MNERILSPEPATIVICKDRSTRREQILKSCSVSCGISARQEYEDGLMIAEVKAIYKALLEHGPLDTVRLRKKARAIWWISSALISGGTGLLSIW